MSSQFWPRDQLKIQRATLVRNVPALPALSSQKQYQRLETIYFPNP